MAKRKIIRYVPGDVKPYIVYYQPRLPLSYITIGREAYENRKELFVTKIGAMARYIRDDETCRQLLLMEYFGQKEDKPCGICDVCIGKKKRLHREERKSLEERILQVLAKQKALPYPQRAQAQAALDLLEADRTALRAGMEQTEAALRTAQQNYAAAKAAVDALRSQQAAAQSSAPAQPLETLLEAAAELTAARDAARGQEKQLAARLLPNRRIMEQYRTAAAQHAALEQRAQWVGALAATAGGTLTSKQKIKLEAYIQMDYLDRILRHANLRLMQMTDAQYELERIGAENQRSQSGLDLGVIDHYNGTRRSVKTLSGGESFKASLALALGLSDEVQSAAGGIRLDTLFLDEGFGSLDEESLEQAMRVLAGLTEGDRLVGIISHVGALKDRIDRQVVVHKNRTGGSTVELVV